jgi:biotin carboxyl carrier protein
MDDRQLTEVYLRDGEITLRVRRESLTMPNPSGTSQTLQSSPAASPVQTDLEDGDFIRAPMPGVFYRTAAPDEPFFVNEGDIVSGEDTLCIIEAMKIFNPIQPGFLVRLLKSL